MAVYLMAAEKVHMEPSHCIVIEDAPSGIEAAKRAGMKCIAVLAPYTNTDDLSAADVTVNSLLDVNVPMVTDLLSK